MWYNNNVKPKMSLGGEFVKKIISVVLFLLCSVGVMAQFEEIDRMLNIKVAQKSDYLKKDRNSVELVKENEVTALRLINWYTIMPANEAKSKKEEVAKWVDKWIEENPNFRLQNYHGLANFSGASVLTTDTSDELFRVYIYLRLKRFLENGPNSSTPTGVEMLVDYYEKNRSLLPRNSQMERFLTMKKNNTLRTYVRRPYLGLRTSSDYVQKNQLFQIERDGNGYALITDVTYNFGSPTEVTKDKRTRVSEELFIKTKQLFQRAMDQKTAKPANGGNEIKYTIYSKEANTTFESENVLYLTNNNVYIDDVIKICELIHGMRYDSSVREADIIKYIDAALRQ